MVCENCEIANCDCVKKHDFANFGRNRNTTQFDFQEGRNYENYYIEEKFFKNRSIQTGF